MLPKISLFEDLSESELDALANIAVKGEIHRGETIFHEGDKNWDLFIVEAGEIEISVNDLTGTEKVIARVREKEFFGEMSLYDRTSARSTTARVVRSGHMIRLPSEKLWPLIDAPTPLSRNLSAKIMQALSRRLREVTQKAAAVLKCEENARGKVISVISSGSGCGKTTFATTVAQLLAREHKRRVLFLDLDLHYGDGTFLLGVYSQNSIVNLARIIHNQDVNVEQIQNHFSSVHENLHILSAPNNIIEAEQLHVENLAGIIGCCQKLFDYVIIDTNEGINPVVLAAIEGSERVFFMLDSQDILNVKNSVRFFQVLNTLRYPENKITVLANKAREDFRPEHLPKTRLRIAGCLPEFQDSSRKDGKTVFQITPQNRYCAAVRTVVNTLLKDDSNGKGAANHNDHACSNGNGKSLLSGHGNIDIPLPRISAENLSILINELKLLLDEGMLPEAEAEARELLNFCHDSSQLYQIFGEILMCREIPEEAVIVLRKAIEIAPDNLLAAGMLGHILGDYDKLNHAIQQMALCCQKANNFADCWNDLGRLHGFAGNYDAAQRAFRKALEINPTFRDARINLAVALGESGQPGAALKELDRLDHKGLRGHYYAGCFHQLQGSFAEAYSEFQMATVIRAEYHDLSKRLEHLGVYFSKIEALVQMHRNYLARHPAFPDLHFKLAELYFQMAKEDEAVAELNEAIRLNPNYKEARQRLSQIKEKSQQTVAAAGKKQ
ncbi:MAG: tetratricopeptide repeat protein [Candidatus Riflebacteria bacterium]|nr:tetratricopeptide repeat protein [Candidatus Riflebacteria bacterium]